MGGLYAWGDNMDDISRMYAVMASAGPWSHLGRAAALIVEQCRRLKNMGRLRG